MDLPQRLAKRLLNLAAAHPEIQAGDEAAARVRLRVTQSELASMLGVSRESVNKQLNSFAREGWIELGRGSVTITDREALRTFA